MEFDYKAAFSRNLGWVTEKEQEIIKTKRIAIAGLGGVGGIHLVTLLRLGFEKFNIADFDNFEIHNFNRQAGAFVSTLGKPKLDVMLSIAKDINPNADIKGFPKGISAENMDEFLSGVDLYLDGLDFFCFNIREKIFAKAYQKKIPAVTAGPFGMGTALINFLPNRMSFDEYFGFSKAKDDEEKAILFAIGLSPKRIQSSYLVAPERIDFKNKKVPSTVMGCQMCSAIAATEVLKILLGRGHITSAPISIQYDAYLNKTVFSWVPFGYQNPIQKVRAYVGKIILRKGLVK